MNTTENILVLVMDGLAILVILIPVAFSVHGWLKEKMKTERKGSTEPYRPEVPSNWIENRNDGESAKTKKALPFRSKTNGKSKE